MTYYIHKQFSRFYAIFRINKAISTDNLVEESSGESPPENESHEAVPRTPSPDSSVATVSNNRRHEQNFCSKLFRNHRGLIAVVICALLLGLVIPIGILQLIDMYVEPEQYTCPADVNQRIPCIVGGVNATKDHCQKAGCCYDDKAQTVSGVQAPFCFHSQPSQHDYFMAGIKGNVDLMQIQFDLKPRSSSLKAMNETTLNAKFLLNAINDGYVRIRGTINDSRYVQNAVTLLWEDMPPGGVSDPLYSVVHSKADEPFALAIVRKADNVTIVAMNGGPLSMTANYVEYNIKTPTSNVYGLGEGAHEDLKHSMLFETWRLFGRSGRTTANGRTYYGVHPFYLCIEDSGSAHGVLLGLSQPSEVALQPGPSISFRTSGGLVELHVFAGPTPKDVIRQMTALVGKPIFPPYWALGYHTCRASGNTSISDVVIPGMAAANISHESDCGDALLMKTLDVPSIKVLDAFRNVSNALVSSDRKFVLYQGPLVRNSTLTSKKRSQSLGDHASEHVFINRTKSSLYVGKVDSLSVVYPDVSGSNITAWMNQQFASMQKAFDDYGILYEGMFLVDNTPLDVTNKTKSPCPSDSKLPPVSKYITNYYKEANDTVCLTALELDGSLHYARHNLYGLQHVRAVSNAINATKNNSSDRMLLSSMSTFSGGGQYSGHWGGESEASWAAMNASIVQLLEFGLYGMPLTGASICGFYGSLPDEDLCWRWMQVGAFYPMALTYYGKGERPREPVFFEKSFQTMTRDVLNLRYGLLPYLYTQFANAHLYGDPVMRPMFYEFPNDPKVRSTKNQFMWGSGVLVVPTLNPNYAEGYFPRGFWYEYLTHRCINSSRNGTYHSLVTSRHLPNVYLKGGAVVVTQGPATTTVESRTNNYTILVALDQGAGNDSLSSFGEVYIDDGLTSNSPVLHVQFQVMNSTYESYPIRYDEDFDLLTNIATLVNYVSIMGIPSSPKEVYVNSSDPLGKLVHYNTEAKSMLLDLRKYNYDLRHNCTISWMLV